MFGQITELLVNILSELRQLNEREISWMKEVREKDKLTELRQDREWAYLQEQWKHQEGQEEVARERAHQYYETIMEIGDRKSTRLNSSHQIISYAVFCLKKKKH